MERLTKTEQEIYLAMCKDGIIDYQELANKFFVEKTTIRTHFDSIRQKFLCKNKAELIFQYYATIRDTQEEMMKIIKGIKHDKNKLRLAEMIIDFKEPLQELCKVWEFGAGKYGKSNWKEVANAKDRYTNALLRHLVAEEDKLTDDETELLHAAHIAFNALARMYFILKNKEKKEHGIN